jgi:hypothetical protein
MQIDLSNNRPIHIDIRCSRREISRPHLSPHIVFENVRIDRSVRAREEVLMAQLSNLVAIGVVDEPPEFDVCSVSSEVEYWSAGGVFKGSAEGP